MSSYDIAGLKIEKGVPLPSKKRGSLAGLIRAMEPGDSIAVPVNGVRNKSGKIYASARAAMPSAKFTVSTRVENDVEVVRIWRTA